MVKHLYTYISEKKSRGFLTYKISIEKEVQKYKSKFPGKTPVVIFDYMSCLAFLADRNEDLLLGGRHSIVTHKATLFCEKFKKLGVEMVFFLDGSIKSNKIPLWLKSSNEKYSIYQENVCKFIHQDKSDKIIFNYRMRKLSIYNANFFQVIRKYGKIHISLENECDLDLAEYATRVKALAVFTPDTDFLIYQGDWSIWLTHNFNLKLFETIAWHKHHLRQRLNLSQKQMSLFSLLSGNDIIDMSVVMHIYEQFDKTKPKQELIAEFIRNNFPNGVPLTKKEMENLFALVYNDGKNDFDEKTARKKIYDSLNMYFYGKRKIPKVQQWLKDHIQITNSTVVYQILFTNEFTINQSYIDMSNKDLKSYSELVLPLVLKQFGVVLNEKRDENPKRIIHYKPNHAEPYQSKEYKPHYPDMKIPKLEELLETKKGTNIASLDDKFKLLAWLIAPPVISGFHHDILKEIAESEFLLPVIVCNNLVKEAQIKVFEADVMLLTIDEIMKSTNQKIMSVLPPTSIHFRPMWIAHVYNRYIDIVRNSMICCGLHSYLKLSHFDGFIFHKMHDKFVTLSHTEKLKIIEPIAKYRIYA